MPLRFASSRFHRALLLTTAVALAACSGDQAPPTPVALVAIGDFQFTGTVAERIPSALTVRVNDAGGSPINGVPVTFSVADGGGSLTRLVDTTKNGGLATTTWTLGERAGTQRVTASAAGLTSVDFTATAKAGAASTMAVNGGNQQSVVAGTAALTAPSVIVKDRFGNPVPGVSVVFTVASGGGTVTGGAASTNAAGVAAVGEWKLGPTVGTNTLTALALSGSITGNPVTFTATATAGTPAIIAAVGSTTFSGTVFKTLATLPQVRVTDANGNLVSGATVTFTGSTGSTVAGGTKTTSSTGIVGPDAWVLGTTVGNYTLTASATGATGVTFTASASADIPSAMSAVAGTGQSAQVGRPVAIEPSVRVADAYGNPTPGVEVLFEVASGGGSAVGRRVNTNALGIATVGGWTLGDAAGANTLTASVQTAGATVPVVTFTATGTAGTPSTMAVSAGQSQTAAAGSAVPVAPAVVVRDARGNPVSGVAVTFSVGTGGGTLTGATATTNANGVATVGSWTLGGAMGAQTLVARSGNLQDVTFTATATAGAAAEIVATSSMYPVGTVGKAVAPLPQVRVVDANGNAVSGVAVTFTASTGSTVTGGSKTTSSTGLASPDRWTLGTTSGNYTLTASAAGVTAAVTFTAGAAADVPSAMTAVAGNNQTAQVSRPVAVEPAVKVTDAYGNAVSGIEVLFEVGSGGGSAVGRRVTTNVLGVATVGGWTLGDAAGSNTLVASVQTTGVTVPAVTFTATGTAGNASSMVVSAGQNQTAVAGTAVAVNPAVVVRDAAGNPVSGATVTFSIGAGAGAVTGGTATTNASGIATVGSWTLGGAVGTQTLIARSGTLQEVTFSATATAGAPARITAYSTQAQSGLVAGAALTASQRPAVRLTDVEGNPVSGVAVQFEVAANGTSGTLTGGEAVATATTNANGIATVGAWTMPTTAGVTATAVASTAGLAETVAFTATTTFGAVSRLVITSGGLATLSTTAGAAASAITITARDANNNVVTSYTGAKSLTFSGVAAAPDATNPTVDAVNVGTATSVTFTNGVATANLRLYKTEVGALSASDGTYSSGTGVLTTTVTSGAATAFQRVEPSAAPPTAISGVAARTYTVKLVDAYGNGVSGATVNFTKSHGVLSAASGTTATDGNVTVTWTNDNAATSANQTVTATSGAISITHTFNVS